MKNLLTFLLIGLISCSSVQSSLKPPQPPIYKPNSFYIDIPAENKLNLSAGRKQSLNLGISAPFDGILIDEDEAKKHIAISAERDYCRVQVISLNRMIESEHYLYEKALYDSARREENLQPNWLERNKGTIGLFVGLVIGGGVAVETAAAINSVK